MLCLELGLLSADGASQGGPSEKDVLAREDAFSEKDLCAKQRNKSSSHVLKANCILYLFFICCIEDLLFAVLFGR
jgi:hypothetical protein